jgi:alpha-1,2-mannosyltransferase
VTQRLAKPALTVFLLLSLALSAIVALKPDRGLLDFGAFYMAGVAQERGIDPYSVWYPALAPEPKHFVHYEDRAHAPNLNPPISLYFTRLLVNVDPGDAMLVLNLASVFVFTACALALLRAYPEHRTLQGVLWLATFGGFWYTMYLGQIYLLLFPLGLVAWLTIQRGGNPLLAALLIGLLVAVKPNFALWPLFLLLAGNPRLALMSFGVAAAVSALPLVLEGPGIYSHWLEAVEAYPRLAHEGNASLVGQAARLGVTEAGYVLSAVLIAATTVLVWRTRPPATQASAWAIVVALLASPIAWLGYGLLAMPVLLCRRWQATEWAVALGLTGFWFALGLGEPVFAAGVAMLYLLAKDQLAGRALATGVEAPLEAGAPQAQAA